MRSGTDPFTIILSPGMAESDGGTTSTSRQSLSPDRIGSALSGRSDRSLNHYSFRVVRLFLIILAALALASATGCGKEDHRTAAPSPAAVVNACNYVTEADVQGATSNQNFRLASVGKTSDGACTFVEHSAQPQAARSISI